MPRPIITAKVGNLKQDGWISIHANGWRIASIWGTGKVTHYVNDGQKYMLDINGCAAFIHLDAIERKVIEPIKEAVGCLIRQREVKEHTNAREG